MVTRYQDFTIRDDDTLGRATLYKYFPGVEEILLAWHPDQVVRNLGRPIR
jgi:hypothetical protein